MNLIILSDFKAKQWLSNKILYFFSIFPGIYLFIRKVITKLNDNDDGEMAYWKRIKQKILVNNRARKRGEKL